MPKLGIARNWCQKNQDILKSSKISVAKKILAYKIFLRPMLVYDWFEKQTSHIKVLEVKALRQIFGTCSEKRLYQKYTDIDVVSYMKLQGIKWQRRTSSRPNNLRRMLHTRTMSSSGDDSTKYFSKAKLCGHRGKTRISKPKFNDGEADVGTSINLRRSRRLASKEQKDTQEVPQKDQSENPQ